MQIAVALGVPVVVPWGPSDLPRNRPRDPRHTVLFQNLPCSPCYRMPGDSYVHLCNDHLCLSTISVDAVVVATRATLDRSPATTSA
jgi:ADP-heptose:LPS heptosyltransferase